MGILRPSLLSPSRQRYFTMRREIMQDRKKPAPAGEPTRGWVMVYSAKLVVMEGLLFSLAAGNDLEIFTK